MNRRTGSIATGPPPEADPTNVALLTQNLQDNPLVAKLVSKGLLKTEDVMNEGYVRDMERSLRKQQITREVEARELPGRRSARVAVHTPDPRAEATGVPGVYRYQRPRFARA